MTTLTLAIRNELARIPGLTALLAKSASWDTWIFDERPVKAAIEGSQKCMIVVSSESPYTGANEHNTLRFPQVHVDVWADPTRDITKENKPVKVYDAKAKIERIFPFVDKFLHRVDPGSASGGVLIWGTAAEVANKTGVAVAGSLRLSGDIEFSPVKDSEGTMMGRITYGVNLL